MKTISLRKKVAAIAVASLGFGLLSVVPANASTIVTATATVSAASTNVTIAGGSGTITVGVTLSAATANSDVLEARVTVVGPSAAAAASTAPVVTCTAATISGNVANGASNSTGGITFTDGAGAGSELASGANTLGTCTFPTALVGSYVITVTLVPATLILTNNNPASTTIYAGFSAGGAVNINKAFPTVGSNIVTGWTGNAGGLATVRVLNLTSSTRYYVNVDRGSLLSLVENDTGTKLGTVTNVNGTNLSGGAYFDVAGSNITGNSMDITVTDTGSVPTTTVKVTTYDVATGAATTFVEATVTWGVAAIPSAQYSLLTLNQTTGLTASGAAADTTATVASNSNTGGAAERFRIQVVVKDQYDVAFTGSILGARIDGTAGSLGISGTANSGGAVAGSALSAVMTSSSVGSVSVFSNGVAGKAVITITATTAAGVSTVLGTKTVTFVGSASKATVTQNLFVAKAGTQLGSSPATTKVTVAGVATTPALTAEVLDSAGTPVVAGSTVRITSSDSTVIVAGTCVELSVDGDPATAGAQPSPGVFECPVSGAVGAASGKSATITFSVLSAVTGLYSIVATPITFTIGGAIAKSVISLDKASYTAGEAMTLLATSTDSSGNAAFDGQTPYASISSNKTLITLPATTKEIVNGKTSTTSSKGVASLFAPATPGSFTISGLYTDAATGTAYSATGSVVDGNAAIATSIASLNAKIVALNALIAKIMKRLNIR